MNLLYKFNGRGVSYYPKSHLYIGYFENGSGAPGNYINIKTDGSYYSFGECYLDEKGVLARRGTGYDKEGTCYKHN